MEPNPISMVIRELEQKLGIQPGFFERLKQEDDWSFVIKAHAFLEALLSHKLISSIGKDELRETIASLNVAGGRTSKLAFGAALGLLDDQDKRFITELSALRNLLVHDIRYVDFDLSRHVSQLDSQKRVSFLRAIALLPVSNAEVAGVDVSALLTEMEQSPKNALWDGVMSFAAKVYLQEAFLPFMLVWILLNQTAGKAQSDMTA